MVKYTNIDAVFNLLPNVIKQDVDTLQVKSWAYQAYRDFSLPFADTLKVAVVDVVGHKAVLPKDIRRIVGVFFSDTSAVLDDEVRTLLQDYGDSRLIVYQEIFFSSRYFRDSIPLAYKGQMRSEVIDSDLYCSNCEIGFSVDSTITCLTIDVADGEVSVVYLSPATQDGEFIIPDDIALLQGLSFYVQAQYWLEKAYAHEDAAYKFHLDATQRAHSLLMKFRGKQLLKAVNPLKHNYFTFARNKYNMNWHRNSRRFF